MTLCPAAHPSHREPEALLPRGDQTARAILLFGIASWLSALIGFPLLAFANGWL